MHLKLVLLILSILALIVNSQTDAGCKSAKKSVYTKKSDSKFVIEDARVVGDHVKSSKRKRLVGQKRVVKDGDLTDEDSEVSEYPAQIMSYTGIIGIPPAIASKLFDGSRPYEYVDMKCDCKFKLGLKISGRWFWISSEKLMTQWKPKSGGMCQTKIYACPTNEYTLGSPFLSDNCVLEDREGMIGFAERKWKSKN